MNQTVRHNSLWDFSVSIYERAGVKPACLEIQDQGLDVNIALWICWTAWQGRDPMGGLGQAMSKSAVWAEEVVNPLRDVRNYLKSRIGKSEKAVIHLRREVLGLELKAEKIQQAELESLAFLCQASHHEAQELADICLHIYAKKLCVNADTRKFSKIIFSALETE